MKTRAFTLAAVCAIGMLACRKSEPPAPPPPPAPSPTVAAPTLATISGEAFLKLTRGTEMLAGMKVNVYDPSIMETIVRMKAESADSHQSMAELTRRVKLLEECTEFKKTALRWSAWQQKVSLQRDDFDKRGYEQIQIYDPIAEENISLSWQHDRETSDRRLTTIVQRCSVRAGAATDEMDKRLHTLGIVSGNIEEIIAAEREKLAAARARALEVVDILRQAEASQKPYFSELADSKGKFTFTDIPRGAYTIMAFYTDPYSNDTFYWCLPVNTSEKAEQRIVLSQADTYEMHLPAPGLINSKNAKPTPAPDVLLPSIAQDSTP